MMTGPNAAIRCPLPVSEIWPLSGEEGSKSEGGCQSSAPNFANVRQYGSGDVEQADHIYSIDHLVSMVPDSSTTSMRLNPAIFSTTSNFLESPLGHQWQP